MALRFGLKCVVAAATVATAAALTIIDVSTDPRQDIDITGTAYPAGLRLLGLGAKNVTLRDVTVGCPGLHVSGGQDAAGHLALVNVTATCNDAPSKTGVIFMNGGYLRGSVVLDSCTVTAPDATQQKSDLLQIRKAAGRLAIRGGRYVLNSSQPTHRCIDLRNVQGTAVITVENVDASVTIPVRTPLWFGTVAAALRVDRMLSGGSVSISSSRFVTEIPLDIFAFAVEVKSAAAKSKLSLRDVSTEVHGRASIRAFGVRWSSCAVTVDGGRFVANATRGSAYAVQFENDGGAATLTSTTMSAVAASTDNAAALSMSTVGGQVTVVDSTLAATSGHQYGHAVSSYRLIGAAAALAIHGCTITSSSPYYAAAVSLKEHRDGSAVSISNSTLQVGPDATVSIDWMSSPDALFVQRISGSATVDVSDSRLVARGHANVAATYVHLGSTGSAVTIVRSTLDAATITGDGALGVVFGYTSTALTLADCTVTARSAEEEAVGVDMYESLSGSVTVLRTAFAIGATQGPAVSGGILASGSLFTDMDGLRLTVSDSTFDGLSSAVPLLFVRLPRRWEGENRVAITNVSMTEQFNSTERGLVSMATDSSSNGGVYVRPGSSATRCLTGLVLGGVAVADNFALPGVPSSVNCDTPAPTAAPTSAPETPVPQTPIPVPAVVPSSYGSASSAAAASSAADASAATSSSSSDTTPDAVVTVNATALVGNVIDITGTAYPAGLRVLGLGAKNVTLRDVTVGCPGLHVSGGQDAAGHLALVDVTATCNGVPANNAVIFMNGGYLFGSVVIDNCTVTAPNATQQGSDLLQIRKVAGRLAIRGGRYVLSSSQPTHRCIDLRNVQGTAVITVENVDASVTVPARTSLWFGTVAAALRVDRMLSGGSVSISSSRFVTEIPLDISAFAVQVQSAAAGSKLSLSDVTAEVHGRALLRAFGVQWSSCTVTVDGGRFVANASRSSAYAVRFENDGGTATITSTSLIAVAASTDNAAALSMGTVGGQVTVIDSTLAATAGNSDALTVSSSRLHGAAAALALRGCTITAACPINAQAVSLQAHSDGAAVTISNCSLSAVPDATVSVDWMSSPEALQVQRMSGSASVDVSDSRLVALGSWRVSAASVTLGSTGAAVSIARSTLEATTVGGDGAFGVIFGYTSSALQLTDCTVTARSGEEEAVGVDMYEALTGSLTVLRTAFAISATQGPAVSGGIIAAGSLFTKMDGLHVTVSDSSFDGSSSTTPMLFVRLPRRWEGENRVAITNVTMTEQFNSTERGLVSMATDSSSHGGVYVKPGSSATRCLTGLVLGGVAVADNFALPGVPSTVDCAAPAPTAAPPPSPTPAPSPAPVTPAPVPVAPTATSNSDAGATPSPPLTSAPVASSTDGVTPAPAVVPSSSASSHESSASVPATPQPTAAPGPSPSPTAAPTATPAPTPAPAASPASTTPAPAPSPSTPSPVAPMTPVPATRPAGTPAPTPAPSSSPPQPSHTPVPTTSNGQRGGGGHAAAGTPDSTPALSTAATVSIAVVAGVAVIVAVIAVAAFLVIRRASRVSPVTTAPDDHRHNNGPFSGPSTTTNSAATTEREMYRVNVFPAPGAVTDPDHNDPFGKLQHQRVSAEAVVVLGQVAQP